MADTLAALLAIWLLSIGSLAAAVWLADAITAWQLRDRYWREFNARRRGSNPPGPGRKSVPPAGPPKQPAYAAGVAAERDRLIADAENWSSEALNAATDAMLEAYRRHTGRPETLIFYSNAKAILRDALSVYFNEDQTQRGHGNGGPSTPKLPIKPQPTGGHLVREGQPWGGYQPRPRADSPNPPPSEP